MNENDWIFARGKLVQAIGLMLDGQLSFIEGSRIVNGFVEMARFDRLSEPFVRFIAIDSETDHVPVGDQRNLWSRDAVAQHADDWARAEAWAKEYGVPACHEALTLIELPPDD